MKDFILNKYLQLLLASEHAFLAGALFILLFLSIFLIFSIFVIRNYLTIELRLLPFWFICFLMLCFLFSCEL